MIRSIIYSIFSICFAGSLYANLPVLKVAVEGTYPPFSYVTSNGDLKGFDVDISKALCRAMKRKCKIVTQNWEGLIPSLQEHKVDFLTASMSITPQRLKVVSFTQPYYYEYGVFVGPKTSFNQAIKSMEDKDLIGKRIGVQTGTSFALYAGKHYTKFADVVYYSSQEDANLDLIAGRLDYIFANAVSINYGLLTREKGKDFQIVGRVIDDPAIVGNGVGIAIRQGDQSLKDALNKALKDIKASGEYSKLTKEYLGFES